MKEAQVKSGIIILVCLFHLLLLLLLFIYYHAPLHSDYFPPLVQNPLHIPETIFSEPSAPASQEDQDDTWAQLRPSASSLANSIEAINDQGIGNQTSDEAVAEWQDSAQEEHGTDLAAPITDHHLFHDWQGLPELTPQTTSPVSKKTSAAQIKKRHAQKTLAGITQGYLEQLHNEGTNLMKTIGGDPNKMPTAQQLRHEQYMAKIQWCLQNAHSINREKCQFAQAIETTMKIYFTISRDGKMESFRIIQSSNNNFVDKYITSLFQFASSSFPPLPAYITGDPYPVMFSVMIQWNVASPFAMGMVHH